MTKASVVIKTVQGLSPLAALQLLSAAADRLQSRPTRGQSMSTWLRPLLLHHASYLMNAPGGCSLQPGHALDSCGCGVNAAAPASDGLAPR